MKEPVIFVSQRCAGISFILCVLLNKNKPAYMRFEFTGILFLPI